MKQNNTLYLGIAAVALIAIVVLASYSPVNPGKPKYLDEKVTNYDSVIEVARKVQIDAVEGPVISPENSPFSVPGRELRINRELIQVYEFASEADALRAAQTISPDGGTIGARSYFWAEQVQIYRSGKVIAIYVGDDADVLRFLRQTFGGPLAGAGRAGSLTDTDEPRDVLRTLTPVEVFDSGSQGLNERGAYAINDEDSLSTLLLNIYGPDSPQAFAPVDFTRYTVIAVFAGEKNSGGYSVDISRVVERENGLVVSVREYVPGQGCIVTQAVTYPYQIAIIPKTNVLAATIDWNTAERCE